MKGHILRSENRSTKYWLIKEIAIQTRPQVNDLNEAYVVETCATEYGIWICKRMKKQWHHVCSWRHVWCSSEAAFQCWHFTGLRVENPYLNGKKNDLQRTKPEKGSIFNFSARFLQPSNHLQSHPLATRPGGVSRMSPKMDIFSHWS